MHASIVLTEPEQIRKPCASRVFCNPAYGLSIAYLRAYGMERGLVARYGILARRWWLWCAAALTVYAVATGVGIAAKTAHHGSRGWGIFADFMFAVSCAAASSAFLALFTRLAKQRNRSFNSLPESAYGIYLVHFAFVSWLQWALLKSDLSGLSQGSLAFAGAALLSCCTASLVRRIPLGTLSRRVV